MKQDYRFAALVHSQHVSDIIYKETVLMGWNIHIVVTTYETALDDAEKIFDKGYEILLCHGGFRNAVFKKFGRRVVFVERSDVDIIKALSKAKNLSNKVALTAHVDEPRDIFFMESILDMQIVAVRYGDKDDLEKTILSAMKSGVKVFVGGGGTARIVNYLGGNVVLDEPQQVNIRNAVNQAVIIAENLRMEQSNLSNVQAMFHYLKEGVICINAQREIVFYNKQALICLRITSPKDIPNFFEALRLDKVLENSTPYIDSIVTVNSRQLLVNTFSLNISSTATGAVCFIHDVQSLRKMNRKIDTDLHSRGLVANYTMRNIVGQSPAMHKLRDVITRYAPTNISMYIHGETGTGKELVAHALHAASKRAHQPFVVVNCAALPAQLLESELFGYEEGAFTGAKRGGKEGLFEMAHNGTLFLDEIGDMSHAMQLRLLRVLDAKEIMHVGGNKFISIDVRIVCASHKQLLDLLQSGEFRMDLYFRLAGGCIELPPLRERLDDIPLLIDEILKRHNKTSAAINAQIKRMILQYSWPGNIRELMAVLESYLVLLGDRQSCTGSFEEAFHQRHYSFFNGPECSLADSVASYRKVLLQKTLRQHDGNRKAAAKALDISYSSVRRILEG